MSISDVLMEAAEFTDEAHWVPKHGNGFSTQCAVTALWCASGPWERSIHDRREYDAAVDFLAKCLGAVGLVPTWNDRQRSYADVQHALRYAALVAASEGR